MDASNNFRKGLLQGGDHLYVKGRFSASKHNAITNNMVVQLFRPEQGGSPKYPTVVKTWPGHPRAIFDGEHKLTELIHVRGFQGAFNAVRIENLEITRGARIGIHIAESVLHAEIDNVEIHHTIGDGISGVAGGILFRAIDQKHYFTVSNSLIYSNRVNPQGSPNNIGGVSILAEREAKKGSLIVIRNNIIYDEERAVRHKHSGDIETRVYNNVIRDSTTGFMVRGHVNEIRDNLFQNLNEVIIHYSSNQYADIYTTLKNNTIIDAKRLFEQVGTSPHKSAVSAHTNVFYSETPVDGIIVLGRWSNNPYTLSDWQSSNNMYYVKDSSKTFLYHSGKGHGFSSAMGYIKDASSFERKAEFMKSNGFDFRIRPKGEAQLIPGAFKAIQ